MESTGAISKRPTKIIDVSSEESDGEDDWATSIRMSRILPTSATSDPIIPIDQLSLSTPTVVSEDGQAGPARIGASVSRLRSFPTSTTSVRSPLGSEWFSIHGTLRRPRLTTIQQPSEAQSSLVLLEDVTCQETPPRVGQSNAGSVFSEEFSPGLPDPDQVSSYDSSLTSSQEDLVQQVMNGASALPDETLEEPVEKTPAHVLTASIIDQQDTLSHWLGWVENSRHFYSIPDALIQLLADATECNSRMLDSLTLALDDSFRAGQRSCTCSADVVVEGVREL